MFVFCLMVMLSGCKTFGNQPSHLPVMPADLEALCEDPGVKAGRDARFEIAVQRKFLALCRQRHRDTVKFYKEVRRLYLEAAK